MAFTNSSLVSYTRISPNRNSPRNQPITKITIHHMAGVNSVEGFGNIVASTARGMSANYAIGNDGRIGLFCPEGDRSWCSSSPWNDHRAITIEVSNSAYGDETGWPVSAAAYASLIKLCVDICKRNGIPKLVFTGDKEGSLTYHYMFNPTACPGPWIKAHTQDICDKVNAQLGDVKPAPEPQPGLYTVDLKAGAPIYDAAGGKKVADINIATKYTIVEEKKVGYITYGKLKSGVGWVVVKDETPASSPTPSASTFKKGDLVKIKSTARYYNGGAIPKWVLDENWYISSISNDRAVLGQNEKKNRNIQSPVNTKDLIMVTAIAKTYTKSLKSTDLLFDAPGGKVIGKVGATGLFTIVEDKSINGVVYGKLKSGAGWVVCYNNADIKKGDWVRVINPIQYGTTRKFVVYADKYKVLEVSGDRLVISSDGKTVTAAIAKINVQKI
jgi:hypothetical protein